MSDKILQLIRKTLQGTAAVTALVGMRIYPEHLGSMDIEKAERDGSVAYPCITLHIQESDSVGRIKEYGIETILLSTWSTVDYKEAKNVFNAARTALNNQRLSDTNYHLIIHPIPRPVVLPNDLKKPTKYMAHRYFQVTGYER